MQPTSRILRLALAGAAACLIAAPALADPIRIVAAENFYDMAAQIGGAHVEVTSVLNSPDQDPHLFEASVATAKALKEAKVVVLNGVDYDPWMEKLLKASAAPGRKEIVVGSLVGHAAGDNPHLWYDPGYMKAAAKALVADLVAVDPDHTADYEQGYAKFSDSLKPVGEKIAAMQKTYAGQPIIASEPVFGYQAGLIGLNVHGQKFALSVMNNAEPSASDVAAFENDLKGHKVKAMLYNAQASEPSVQRLVQMAKDNGIPVVGVSETEPPNANYQSWMLGQLNALDHALSSPTQ
jgi:zinc/manganese transport system substrate-binding protein